jgi:hypothetical protein
MQIQKKLSSECPLFSRFSKVCRTAPIDLILLVSSSAVFVILRGIAKKGKRSASVIKAKRTDYISLHLYIKEMAFQEHKTGGYLKLRQLLFYLSLASAHLSE